MTKLAVLFLLCFSTFAQTFDVATVKLVDPKISVTIPSATVIIKPGTVYLRGITLGYALEKAYDVQNYQIDGPEWMFWRAANDQPRYDIQAKTSADTPLPKMKVMLQNLLVERFGLQLHFEDRQKTAWVFVPDSRGLKLNFIEETDGDPKMTYDPGSGKMEFLNMNMLEFCGNIALTIKEPVVDGTGLGDKAFNASGLLLYERGTGEMVPALFRAIKKDLGLDAERKKTNVRTLVIEKASNMPVQEQ
jgi:uncharacterized protein (TIGR03435 family)